MEAALRRALHTGTLTLTGLDVDVLPERVYAVNSLSFEGDRTWEYHTVEKIDVSHGAFSSLSEEAARWGDALVTLIAEQGALAGALPGALGELRQLSVLRLRGNRIDAVPALPQSLTYLDLSDNRLASLDGLFAQPMPCLSVLHLSGNAGLGAVPGFALSRLSALTTLRVDACGISSLPHGLTRLRELSASENELQDVSGLFDSTELVKVELNACRLSALPDGPWGSLVALVELQLQHNRLSALPPSFYDLASVKMISLAANPSLTALDGSRVLGWRALERLNLSGCDLNTVPGEVGLLPCLKKLTLDGNPLRRIRRDVVSRGTTHLLAFLRDRLDPSARARAESSLRGGGAGGDGPEDPITSALKLACRDALGSGGALDLRRYAEALTGADLSAAALPEGSRITSLTADGLRLMALPPLDGLPGLTRLDASKCDLELAPDAPALVELLLRFNRRLVAPPRLPESLRVLDLTGCPLAAAALNDLPPQLRELLLEHCALRDVGVPRLPPALGEGAPLEALETLNLGSNALRVLPPTLLARVPALAHLNVECNDLQDLPNELAELPLTTLTVHGNPMRRLRAIIGRPTPDILQHLRRRVG